MHPFTHAQTAAAQREEIYCATSHLVCKRKLCCHGKQHNGSCCALCPVCDVYARLSRWWWGHKSLVWTATTDSARLSFRGAAILALQVSSCTQEHRQTWLQASSELSQCRCRLGRSKLALSKLPLCLRCILVRHQMFCSKTCAVILFHLWDLSSLNWTTTSKGCCYCLLTAVPFLGGLLISWGFSTPT